VKFKDSELVGFPIRVGIGEKSLAKGEVEIKTARRSPHRAQSGRGCGKSAGTDHGGWSRVLTARSKRKIKSKIEKGEG